MADDRSAALEPPLVQPEDGDGPEAGDGNAEFEVSELRLAASRLPGSGRLRFALVVAAALLVVQVSSIGVGALRLASTWGLVLCLLALVLAWFFQRASSQKLWRKIEGVGGSVRLHYGRDGLTFSTGSDRSHFDWGDIRYYQETEEAFFIHTTRYKAQVLPKASLGAGDLRSLRALLRKRARSRSARVIPFRLIVGATLLIAAFLAWAVLERPARRAAPPPVILELAP